MRKARRWNNECSKRSVFETTLEQVVGDLFPGDDQPERRRSSTVRPSAKPRRHSFALEALEPRLLLSADTPFSASQATTLTAGLQGLSTWAHTLDHSGALAQSLPTYTQSGTDPNLPKTYDTLGSKVDLGSQIDKLLATPLKNYFAANPTPTLSGLVATLDAVDGVNVTGSVTGGEITLAVQLDASVAPTTDKIDVISASDGIQTQTSLDVSEHLKFNFTFGLDLTAGLSAPEAFFIQVPDDGLVLSADGHKDNIAGFAGRAGFLDVTFGDGTANSKIDLDADVNVKFTNSEVNADGKITLSELQGTELANLVTQSTTGALAVNLPTKATLGSFTPNGLLGLADANVFDAVAPVATLTGFGDMLKFNNISSAQMLGLADELGVFLTTLQARDVLSFDVPFVKGENLSALDDFGSVFAAKLTSDTASNGLRQLVHAANPDGTGEVLPNTPSFASAQELGKKLATALGLPDASASIAFDAATGELTYHIKLTTSATENVSLDVPNTDALRDVTTSNPAALTETGTLEFTFGINLSPVAQDGIDSLERHFFLKDAALDGNITMSSPTDIGAFGSFGFVDFGAGPSGSGTAELTKSLKDPSTSAPKITLENLLTGVISAPAALTTAGALSGASHVDLTSISVFPAETGIVGTLGSNPTITLSKTAPDAPTALTTSAGAAPLLKFANLKGSDIVAALQTADAYLGKIATLGALGAPLPVIGVSAADFLHLADALDATIASLQAGPPQSLASVASSVSAALTAAGKTAVTVSFAADGPNALKLSLQFSSSTTGKVPLSLDLAGLASIADDQGTHNADDQVGLVDVTAPANRIDVDGNASFKLDLGIDLSNPAQPAPFIYDTSSLTLGIHVAETGLNLALVAGPLQIAVSGGSVLIDKDGPGATNDPAAFEVDVKDPGASPNGRITPDELTLIDAAADVGVVVTGQIHTTLPATFGNPSASGILLLDINNLANELAHQANSVNFLDVPDFSSRLNTGAVASNLGVVADGLDSLLRTLQAALNSQVFGKDLPLVGANLASLGTGVIDKFRNDFINAFKSALGSNPDETAVNNALFIVLHDQLKVLGDTDGSSVIDAADVQVTDTSGLPEFKFLLVEPVFTASTDLGFDLGLPGLGLKSDAKVKADLSFNWLVDFGVSLSDGFFLNTAANDELDLKLKLSIPNATASGDLAFLHLAIDDKGSNLTGDIKVDLKDVDNHLTLADIASGPNFASLLSPMMGIQSKVDLNLNLSFGGVAELPSFNTEFLMQWDFNAAGPESAASGPSVLEFKDVTLELGSFVSDFLKPIVDDIKQVFDPIKPVLDFLTDPIPVLSDIPGLKELLGDGTVSPDPAKGLEVIEIASRVLSVFGVPPQIFDAIAVIDKVNDIANLLSAPNPANQLGIDLGTFDIAGALADQGGDVRQTGSLTNLQIPDLGFDPITKVKDFVDNALPDSDILRQATDKLFTSAQRAFKIGGAPIDGLGATPGANDLRFPVLDDPKTLFGLLLGRDVNLFELDLAPFSLDTGLLNIPPVPLIGPLSIGLFGNLNISGDFAFGYDTHGLVEFATKFAEPAHELHPELLADGFFVSDTGNPQGTGPDIPELTVQGAIGVEGKASIAVAAISAKGGVFANLSVNLADPDHDGKVRASEIADEIKEGPLCIFDTSGDVHAGITAYIKVGVDTPVGFVGYEDDFDIANKVILNLDHTCDVTPPVLASLNMSNGTLTLNMGPNAGARGTGAVDEAENFSVTQVGDGVVDVSAYGQTQRYGDKGVKVTSIFADGGNFDDVITLDPSMTIGSTLRGGVGNDQITGGSGRDNISGGTGNDSLSGGASDDVINGDDGNDLIFGNAGADRIDGGSGDDRVYGGNGADDVDNTGDLADTIFGGPGNDNLYGNLGDDKLWGGAGNDQLYGGDGNDTLAGGDNGDLIEGGLGADKIYGDADLNTTTLELVENTGYLGNDSLFGDARTPNHPNLTDGDDFLSGAGGADLLVGNAGNDELHGGDGNDRLQGNSGDDKLFGENGDDLLSGGVGNDQLLGGDGNDTMFGDERIAVGPETVLNAGETDADYFEGGKGDDTMYGGAGDDRMIGGTSSTLSTDQDATGNDFIAGESGNDTLLGDNAKFGSIILIGGAGNDTLLGGPGDDLIYGQGGNDTAEGGSGNDTIYGNAGDDSLRGQEDNDYIEGGSGSDTILGGGGDDSLIGGASLTSGPGLDGGTDVGDLIVGDAGNDVILGDNGTITGAARDVVTDASGGAGNDLLFGGSGDDVIFGEGLGDTIVGDVAGGTGLDILVGDQGTRTATLITAEHSTAPGSGGADTMFGSGGADILLGGDDADTISGDAGNDIVVGDDGKVTLANGIVVKVETAASPSGGADTITGGADADVALGGDFGDSIDGGAGGDVLLGDNGFVDFLYNGDTDASTLDRIRSNADNTGAADTISGGAGGDVAIGGTGGDTIYGDDATASNGAADGADILIGDNAEITLTGHSGQLLVQVAGRVQGSAVVQIKTTDMSETTGGIDTISGDANGDVILGGVAGDTLYGDSAAPPAGSADGNDLILGDNGEVDFADGTLSLIRSYLDKAGGIDTISGNAGGDVVLGGTAGDVIYGDDAKASAGDGDGADILLGDNADITLVDPKLYGGINGDAIGILGGGIATIETTDATQDTGGSDTIVGNAGGDIIAGGVFAETIYGDAPTPGAFDGNDVILGDNGRLEWLYQGDKAFASIESGLPGAFDNVLATLDLITTEVPASHPGGRDTIYGDAGNDIAFGGEYADALYGDFGTLANSGGGSDILFGDHGRIYPRRSALPNFPSQNFFSIDTGNGVAAEGDRIWGESGDDVLLGEQGDDRLFGGSGNDDIIGGSDTAGAIDELGPPAPDIAASIDGVAFNDLIDGGSGDDAIAGDNAIIWRKVSFASARFQALTGTTIYSSTDSTETVNVTGTPQNDPNPVVGRDITLLDHSDSTPVGLYGADVIAGGAGNDLAFGELGDDLIQGDGLLDVAPAANIISRTIVVADTGLSLPNTSQMLYFNVPEAASDGDDYIEGNGGSDLIYGGLGQDDIIGGSSGLFGLTTSAQRPDAGDTIYGGAATPAQLQRNSAGTSGLDSHARDADAIAGDNADIYRIVGINGAGSGKYLTFNYDATFGTSDVRGTLRIVPRAIQLLDYTLGGPDYNPTQAATDRGGADLIHGEGGDDIAYGMKGDDVLYGEGQNDDLIGGYGNDWISGGTGDDGVIGDDGRLKTSRNGFTEPLYGIDTATVQQTISTPGNIQLATINATGTLTKEVDLTPFSNDPTWNASTDEFGGVTHRNADDIIFGGLGNDFLHGGSGDDAISGAEALALSYAPIFDPQTHLQTGFIEIDYSHPVNPGYVLGFNPIDTNGQFKNVTRAGEFALYDEYNPLRRITVSGTLANGTAVNGGEYFLNFDANDPAAPAAPQDSTKKTDGDDRIFGDLGNDWIVGGTGRDDMYGGFGNDLLNADDDLTTNGGANDQPETSASYEDRAFGGAGRDVMIANTGGDRLIDWTGEFNTYLVPFAPFGMATVSRTLQPHLMDFLYALSAADGADPTRAADKASLGADPARNGEPWGELGLVLQKDAAWGDQHGGPADPQAGNIPGGQRDVLRSASFDNGNPQGFVPASGTWSVVNGRYQVAPSASGADAISLFNEADTVIPNYFEMQATINAVKPLGGVKANAYLIFDYQSPTDFKYAGINVSNNSLEIGHRTVSGWVLDKWTNLQVKPGNDYVVMLTINSSTATISVGTTSVSFTYPVRVDALGIGHVLNYGLVGIGANNASAQIDDVVVQAPPGATTLDKTADFSSTSPASLLFGTPRAGTWTITTDGRFLATASAVATPAIDLINYPVVPGSTLTILTTLKTFGQGGVVFDYQGPTAFKYAVLSADSRQIIIGHVLGNANVVDATYNTSISSGTDYKLGVTLRGGLVNVSLNDAVVVSKLYNETITQGGYGLISFKGNTSGQTSFDVVEVKTDDAVYAPTAILQVASDSAPAGLVATLTDSELASIVVVAKELWTAALGPDDARLAALDSINVQIGNLPPGVLGETIGDTIIIDSSAAGWGWFVDPTPGDNSEFQVSLSSVAFAANSSSPASARIDLLTTVLHEMGNAMGFAEDQGQDVTGMVLQTGERRLPIDPQPLGQAQEAAQPAILRSGTAHGRPPISAGTPLPATASEYAAVAKIAESVLAGTVPVSSIKPGAAATAQLTSVIVFTGAPFAAALPEAAMAAKLSDSTVLVGTVPTYGIVLRAMASPQSTAAAATSNDLRGSFVSLGPSLTGDLAGAGVSLSAPAATLPQTDSPAAEYRSSRLADNANGASTIDWDNRIEILDHLAFGPSAGSRDWLDDFLNHLGQSETQRNPNAGIRVRPTLTGHA